MKSLCPSCLSAFVLFPLKNQREDSDAVYIPFTQTDYPYRVVRIDGVP